MSKSNKNCVDGPSQRLLQDGLFRTTITGRGAVGKDRTQRLIQVINKIPLFSGLGPTQVQAVLGACSPQRFEAGDVMCAAGTPGEELFILLSGQASVFYAADDTESAQITPVSTIGEMSIATKQIRTSTVKATQVSHVLVIKRMALDVALKADTEAQAKILRNVVEILAMRMPPAGRRNCWKNCSTEPIWHWEFWHAGVGCPCSCSARSRTGRQGYGAAGPWRRR
jgi:hypothetical protein